MATKQKTRFAILGLLSWKPMSGYDIKKLVDAGLSHFWNENYGQIYPTLESLVADKMAVKRESTPVGKRRRIVYSITRKGKRAFESWVREPTDSPIVRNELQLKFFLSSDLATGEAVRLVEEYRTQQNEILGDYRESAKVLRRAMESGYVPEALDDILHISGSTSKQRMRQCKVFYLTLRHGIRAIEARITWCNEAITCMED